MGPYIADFACLDAKLIIEVDGGQHAGCSHDAVRDASLERTGFTVLRFWNNDVLENIEGVVEEIMRRLELTHPHPGLPPQAGEGAGQRAGEGAGQRAWEGSGQQQGAERISAGRQRDAGKVGSRTA